VFHSVARDRFRSGHLGTGLGHYWAGPWRPVSRQHAVYQSRLCRFATEIGGVHGARARASCSLCLRRSTTRPAGWYLLASRSVAISCSVAWAAHGVSLRSSAGAAAASILLARLAHLRYNEGMSSTILPPPSPCKPADRRWLRFLDAVRQCLPRGSGVRYAFCRRLDRLEERLCVVDAYATGRL